MQPSQNKNAKSKEVKIETQLLNSTQKKYEIKSSQNRNTKLKAVKKMKINKKKQAIKSLDVVIGY